MFNGEYDADLDLTKARISCQMSGVDQLVHCKAIYLLVVGRSVQIDTLSDRYCMFHHMMAFNDLYNRPLRYAKPYTGRDVYV